MSWLTLSFLDSTWKIKPRSNVYIKVIGWDMKDGPRCLYRKQHYKATPKWKIPTTFLYFKNHNNVPKEKKKENHFYFKEVILIFEWQMTET